MVLRGAQTNLTEEKIVHPSNNLDATNEELDRYKNLVKDLETRLSDCTSKNQEYEQKITANKELENSLKEKLEELEKLRKDQEDLLELLTDQDSKITLYKDKLEALGVKVQSIKIVKNYCHELFYYNLFPPLG